MRVFQYIFYGENKQFIKNDQLYMNKRKTQDNYTYNQACNLMTANQFTNIVKLLTVLVPFATSI